LAIEEHHIPGFRDLRASGLIDPLTAGDDQIQEENGDLLPLGHAPRTSELDRVAFDVIDCKRPNSMVDQLDTLSSRRGPFESHRDEAIVDDRLLSRATPTSMT
jgi:hypothetical protein